MTTGRPLKVGLMLPTYEASMVGGTPRWSDFMAITRHAEAVGFDSVWLPDHMMHDAFQQQELFGCWDCWSLVSALAAVTSRIEIGTLVVCTGFRNPALTAKMADTVEEISGGRLILGLGAGYFEPEFRAYGHPFDHLLGRFEEALKIIHTLLRTGAIDFQGQYYQARDCELRPRGPRPGGPPIMIGARPDRPRALRLTAQYADYWNIFHANRPHMVPPMRQAVDAACAKAGRDPATLLRTVTTVVDLTGVKTARIDNAWTRVIASVAPATGTSDELAETLRGFARNGVNHIQLLLEPCSMAAIDAFAAVLERLDRG